MTSQTISICQDNGLASSIGLQVWRCTIAKVIAIDGDGSILTNLGTLPTIANNTADNFILLIIDNGSYGSTGDQPTYARRKTSLTKVAEACGLSMLLNVAPKHQPLYRRHSTAKK